MIRWVLVILVSLSSCDLIQEMIQEESRTHSVDTVFITLPIHDTISYTEYTVNNARVIDPNSRPNENPVIKTIEKHVAVVKTVYGDPGNIVYSIPDSMTIGKIYRVKVRIQKGSSKIQVNDLYKPVSSNIQTSSVMGVEIIDPERNSFEIKRINSEEQSIEESHFTQWDFSVTPIKPGSRNLIVRVAIKTSAGEKEIVFEDKVIVKNRISVHVKSFWKEHWQWVFSTLLIPIFLYFWNKSRKQRSNTH